MPGTDISLELLREYQGSYPAPADFAEHWEEVKSRLENYPLDITEEEQKFAGAKLNYRRLTLTAFDGCQLSAKYVCPDKEGSFPTVVQFHDYPMASRSWFHLSRYAAVGCAVLAPDCRGQGGRSEAGMPGRGSTAYGPLFNGLEDEMPNLYLHRLMEDALLWILAAKALPSTDSGEIVTYGEGQGAGLAIAAAAVFAEIKKCGMHYPMLCDYYRVWEKDFDVNAYEGLRYYFRWKDPEHQWEREIFDKLAYVDVKNFAPMVQASVLMSTGLQDIVSPPSAQFAVANGIKGTKKHLIYPKHGHELNNFFENEWLKFLLERK